MCLLGRLAQLDRASHHNACAAVPRSAAESAQAHPSADTSCPGTAKPDQSGLRECLQGVGTLQLLAKSFISPQDIMYISVGRWHASNCDGVSSKFASILDGIGRFAQEHAATIPNIYFSPSPFDHVACGSDK
jgi:hypothetical protein